MSVLNASHFHDEAAAYRFVEARVWPEGRVCPHCGVVGDSGALKGKSTRVGVYKCYACRKPFTVKVGTIFESSHIKLHLWLQAIFLMCSSKKGISANQLARTLGITLKSAWFMGHRIREAMKDDVRGPIGGEGKTVEADETYFGPRDYKFSAARGWIGKQGTGGKMKIIALVERGGKAKVFHVDKINVETCRRIALEHTSKGSRLMTDESGLYNNVASPLEGHFNGHGTVLHTAGEYVRRGTDIHTNTIEGYFSVFKRGMRGTYQQCGKSHLHRYLAEFNFRYNNRVALGVNDEARTNIALRGIVGKRLTYQTTGRGE